LPGEAVDPGGQNNYTLLFKKIRSLFYGGKKQKRGTYRFTVYGVQAQELYDKKEPEEYPGKTGIEKILQIRQEAYPS
jgi:hypothetical protein